MRMIPWLNLRQWFLGGVLLVLVSPAGWAQNNPIPVPETLDNGAPPLQLDAGSQEVPQGQMISIRFLTPLDTSTNRIGDPFLAETMSDLRVHDKLILPKGSTIRGRVESVEKPRLLGKGGLMRLNFDHAVLPTGDLSPMALQLNATSDKVTQERVLYTDPGLGAKLDSSWDKGVAQYKSLVDKGIQAGHDRGGGANMLLTVPTTAIAGVVTGTAVTTANAAKAVFGRGENVVIQPGESMTIDFSQAMQLPSQ